MIIPNNLSSSPNSVTPDHQSSIRADKIPALVISGYLGAGKTTLVQHLLKEAQKSGLRLAVISNEFGEMAIDQALLGKGNSVNYVELEGGCVCCKLSDELVSSLQQLWEKVQPDRIVVETSGVALPFDTLLNFWRDPVSQWVEDCIAVVVVNAEQVVEGRDLDATFEQQVSSADLLIINKIDMIKSSQFEMIEGKLQNLAPGTPMIHASNAVLDTNLLFLSDHPKSSYSYSNRKPLPHTHEDFTSEEIVVERNIDVEVLIEQIKAREAIRVKGFIETSEGLRLLQGVGTRIDLTRPSIQPPTDLIGRLMLIRRSLCDK